jgi:hypothetical protein
MALAAAAAEQVPRDEPPPCKRCPRATACHLEVAEGSRPCPRPLSRLPSCESGVSRRRFSSPPQKELCRGQRLVILDSPIRTSASRRGPAARPAAFVMAGRRTASRRGLAAIRAERSKGPGRAAAWFSRGRPVAPVTLSRTAWCRPDVSLQSLGRESRPTGPMMIRWTAPRGMLDVGGSTGRGRMRT